MRDVTAPLTSLPERAADALERVRARAPRVHCVTNAVAQNFTANVLLAAGAIPSMTIAPEEVGAFVGRADGLLINLGTFDRDRRAAADIAIGRAAADGKPWVLDPVFIDRSPPRADLARSLAARGPAAIRLNDGEFRTLAGADPNRDALLRFARERGGVVARTGAIDLVTDGRRVVEIANGHPFMAKVTAMGDAASALIAAFLAVEPDPWHAVAAALLVFGVAGEVAGDQVRGPGSFATAIIDVLYVLDGATLIEKGRVS